ncbi:transcriptional enhancer factor TEF-3-like [Watersipora subatra]|uniref:transcriptional enhancer factor TEF-3-like n=1 Tax=Watersipora subatra TaxID=2589382 RepID=UPI00355B3424
MATVPTWHSTVNNNSTESAPSVSTSDGTNDSELGVDEDGTDAEGVWSPDIEQSFQEALAIYPPCGRRKIILSDEGKMYGRNELIARYIKLRTGKTRSRKQVSSHIQVLARRKSKDIHTQLKACPNAVAKERALQSLSAMSSSQIVSASSLRSPPVGPVSGHQATSDLMQQSLPPQQLPHQSMWTRPGQPACSEMQGLYDGNMHMPDIKPRIVLPMDEGMGKGGDLDGSGISAPRLKLKDFVSYLSAEKRSDTRTGIISPSDHIFVQLGPPPSPGDPPLEVVDVKQIYDKFPGSKGGLQDLFGRGPNGAFFLVKFWADLNFNAALHDDQAFYGVNMTYESRDQMLISCSTKVCSFGKEVVEKVETDQARYEDGRYMYKFLRSPMCDYMVTFIHKLKQLPEKYMMNSVLENFSILQVVRNQDTQETLLCIAFVFEVSTSDAGCEHSIYRLVRE